MKGMKRVLISGVMVVGMMVSCTESNTDSKVSNDTIPKIDSSKLVKPKPQNLQDTIKYSFKLTEEDKKLLTLIEKVQPGFSYTEVQKEYDGLKGIRPESSKDYLAEEGYTESLTPVPMLGGEAKWEVNFKDDSVYYHFFVCQKSEEDSKKAFESLMWFFESKYGSSRRDPLEEENTFSQSAAWKLKDNSTLFLKYDLNTGQLFWGRRIDQAL
jgi:hypothetical protein